MAVTADKVVVELEAKLDRYNQRIIGAERQFDSSMKRIQGSAARTELLVTRGMRNLSGAIGLVGTVALARGLLSIADQAKNLDAQLRLATAQSGNFAQATDDVRRIAESTRSSLGATADLYGSFQRNAKELGITQMQAARATETLTKTLTISGAGAGESAAAIRQFSQALASGVLRGDEFNSIMENAPRLARLLADSLGVPVGALRKMAEEGQLTADKLTRALTDQRFTDGIDAEFKQLPVTFDQAMGQLHNAAVITFGAFDRGGQFSTAIANFISDGTQGFSDLEAAAEQAGINIRAAFEGLDDVFDPMLQNALQAFGIIGQESLSLRDSIASLLSSFDAAYNVPLRINQFVERQVNKLPGRGAFLVADPDKYKNQRGSDTQGTFLRRFDQAQARGQGEARDRSFDARFGGAGFQRFLAEPGKYNIFGQSLTPPKPTAVAEKDKKKKKGPSAETLARREEAARLAEERRQQAFDNEFAASSQDLLDARRALVNSAEIIAQLDRQNIETERARYDDNLKSQVSQKKLTEAEAEKLRILNDETASLKVQLVDRREAERKLREQASIAEAGLNTERDLLQGAAQLAEKREDQLVIQRRLLSLEFEMERARLDAILASKESTEAERKIAEARLRALPTLEAQREAALNRQHESPMERYRREIRGDFESIGDAIENIEIKALRDLEDSLVRASKKALGLSGALGDIAGELLRIGIQRQVLGPLADMLFGPAPGGGSGAGGGGLLGGFLGSLFGGGMSSSSLSSTIASNNSALAAGLYGPSVPRGPIWGQPGHEDNYPGRSSPAIFPRRGIFGGFFATGGRPPLGKISIVGERGPELFVPDGPGTIVPQGKAIRPVGGAIAAARPQITVISAPTFDLRHAVTTPQLMREVDRVSQVNAQRAAVAMGQGVLQAVPSRMSQFQTDGS